MSKPPFRSDHEETLYEQYQDAVHRLFGGRRDLRGVKLTPDQEAAKRECENLERELTTARLADIHNALHAQHQANDAARCAEAREATRQELAENNLREGQLMVYNPGELALLLGSARGHGVLRISKRGEAYVSYQGKPRELAYWTPA